MEVAILMVRLSVSEFRDSGFLLLPFFWPSVSVFVLIVLPWHALGFPSLVGEVLTLLDDTLCLLMCLA